MDLYCFFFDRKFRLCLVVGIALPIATPDEYRNTAKFALWDFVNRNALVWTRFKV